MGVDFEGGLDLASFRFGLVIIVIGCHVVADVDDNDLLQCLRGSQLPAIPVTGSGFNLFFTKSNSIPSHAYLPRINSNLTYPTNYRIKFNSVHLLNFLFNGQIDNISLWHSAIIFKYLKKIHYVLIA